MRLRVKKLDFFLRIYWIQFSVIFNLYDQSLYLSLNMETRGSKSDYWLRDRVVKDLNDTAL